MGFFGDRYLTDAELEAKGLTRTPGADQVPVGDDPYYSGPVDVDDVAQRNAVEYRKTLTPEQLGQRSPDATVDAPSDSESPNA